VGVRWGQASGAQNELKMAVYAAFAVRAMTADAALSVTSRTSARPSAGSARLVGALGRLLDALVRLSTVIGRAAQKSLLHDTDSTLAVRAKESVSARRRDMWPSDGVECPACIHH